MPLRLHLLAGLLLAACTDPEPPCDAAERQALSAAAETDPIGVALARLKGQPVLVVGEFHGLRLEIEYLSQLVQAAAAAGLDFDLGMELLPASAQAELDRLVSAPAFDEALWWRIAGERYRLSPLMVRAYIEPVRAAWQANQGRKMPIRVIGLAPPCGLDAAGREAAIDCLADRDGFMARRIEAEVLGRGRKLLLSAGLRHAAETLVWADGEPRPTVASLLEQARPGAVASLLLAGAVDRDPKSPDRWAQTCDGLFARLYEVHGRPYAVDLDQPPFNRLPEDCVDPAGEYRGSTLGDAYDLAVYPGPPEGVTEVLPLQALEAMGPERLQAWNRFEVEVLGAPESILHRDARGWHAALQAEATGLGALPLAPPGPCLSR